MPEIRPGDLVEIRYELSRTQQTQAVFQGLLQSTFNRSLLLWWDSFTGFLTLCLPFQSIGYCVEVRDKDLDSCFVLKNTYDGVGVTQLVPKHSPRLLNVRVSRNNEVNIVTLSASLYLKVPVRVNAPLEPRQAPTTKDFRWINLSSSLAACSPVCCGSLCA